MAAFRAFCFALAFAVVAFFLDAFTGANIAVAGSGVFVASGAAFFEGLLMFGLLFVAGLLAWDEGSQLITMAGVSLVVVLIAFNVHGWQGLATPADAPLFIVINFWWIVAFIGAAAVAYHMATYRKGRRSPPARR
ncbi:MAG TPA: hypothetical protein VN701_01495 [Candidatus Paceibacterota bacterium]|nr:hypothetical protein [Candidatus Paceibacterota bacterium]